MKELNCGWSRKADCAINQAIDRFELRRLGWRGFEELPWVLELFKRYPLAREIAWTCSSISGSKIDELQQVLSGAGKEDRQLLQSYFVGKLALEELSCRLSGAGAGACDKRAAFLQIFHHLQTAV